MDNIDDSSKLADREQANDSPEARHTGASLAAAYARGGFHVVALHSVDERGHCTCGHRRGADGKCVHGDVLKSASPCRGCAVPGAHPRIGCGTSAATVDERAIDAWWQRWPDSKVGVACGRKLRWESGYLYVIRIANLENVDTEVARLLEAVGPLPDTKMRATDDALELWFRSDEPLTSAKANAWLSGVGTHGVAVVTDDEEDFAARDVFTFGDVKLTAASSLARLPDTLRDQLHPPKHEREKVGAGMAYDGSRVKVNPVDLASMLYNWPDWDKVVWYDTLAEKIVVRDPPIEGRMTLEKGEMSESDLAGIRLWLDQRGFLASKDAIRDALANVARKPDRQLNAIARYLDSLPDVHSVDVLPTLATDVFGCSDAQANVYLMKTLVAAAKRARRKGHFHKAMLVLKGEQQCGKTPAVKILAGDFYHTTGNGNLADRDTILECQGKLLVEVEELSALNKADADALKTAISRTHDVITKKYAPDGKRYDRSFVLIGTTNKDEFLTDATGNARYWVIECGQIDLARLETLRDQIWAEADYLARNGESNELDFEQRKDLDESNEAYLNTHPWLDEVARYLVGKTEVASATEVLLHVVKGDTTKIGTREKNTVADLMRTLKCKRVQRRKDGRRIWVWTVPAGIQAPAKPSASVVALRPATRR